MIHPPQLTRRQLILPWLTLLLTACGGSAPADLVAISHPSLDAVEPEARAQLEEARGRVETLEASGGAAPERAEALGELGRLYQGYDFDDAARGAYENAAALAGGDFRWLYYLGSLELGAGDLNAGRDHLEGALAIDSENVPTLLRLGQAALDGATFDEAARLYSRAAEAEPGCAAAHFGLGLAAAGSHDPQRAIQAFEQALDLQPSALEVHRPLAMSYRALGQTERARDHLARSGTAMPSCPDPLIAEIYGSIRGATALIERATLADLEGRANTALDLARQAVDADPDHAAARRLYGQLLSRAGRSDDAIVELQTAAQLEPEDRRTYLLLGRAHRARGQIDASARDLKRAIELEPRYSRARIELARSQIESGRWSEARTELEEGLTLDPDNLDLRVQLARTKAAAGDLSESRRELEAIVAQDPELSIAHLALGTMDLDAGRASQATEHLEAALESETGGETLAMAHYQLARLQLGGTTVGAGGDGAPPLGRAKQHLETAIALSPGFVQAKLALGEIELAQERTSEATRLFADAAEMRPDLPQPRAGEARALLLSGRHLNARRKLEQANRDFPDDPEIAHLLARVLATAPAPRVRNGKRALELATGLYASHKSLAYGETLAMALAELGRYPEAVEWQQRLLDQARTSNAGADVLEPLEARLVDYERGRPIREAWMQP